MAVVVNKDKVSVGVESIGTSDLPSVQKSTEVAEESLLSQKQRFEEEIRKSGVIDKLTSEISISDSSTITQFGREAANALSKVSDGILAKYDPTQLDKTSDMMAVLAKIMDEIDIKELTDQEKKGLFARLTAKAKMSIDELLNKYNTIGSKLEKVCIELRKYEKEIEKSNKDLEKMYDANIEFYRSLLAYIIAGDDAMRQVDDYLAELQSKLDETGDPQYQLEIDSVNTARDLLEQQVNDLRMANTVALQALPRIKAMEYTNWNLARKINSSFIITIPLFKGAVTEAIIMRQQKQQANSLATLDEKTRELMAKNSKMSADNMRGTARLAGSSAIKVEDIENSWREIISGIEDTKKIREEIAKQRAQDKIKLEEINNKYMGLISAHN